MFKFSTSMMCADPFELNKSIKIIDKQTDYYHLDIMDGHFVPNLSLSLDYVRYLKEHSTKPIDVHLMVTDPTQYIDDLINIGVSLISFHISTVKGSAFRLIQKIKDANIKVGIIINPTETIEENEYLFKRIDRITIMTVEPGFAGQKMIPEVLPKIKKIKEIKENNAYTFEIEIDGSNNFETFQTYIDHGAEVFILGSCLFNYSDLNIGYKEIKTFIQNSESLSIQEDYVVGVDIGGTFTRIGIVNKQNEVFELKKELTEKIVNDVSTFIIQYAHEYLSKYNIAAISFGFPGIVDAQKLEVISIPNQRKLENSNYLKTIAEELKLPIFIDKDTNLLMTYDIYHLNLENRSSVLGFYLGTGFGNAIKLNHKLIRGDHGYAGEIGHTPRDNFEICGCGKTGCVETQTSGVKLTRIQQEYFTDYPIDQLFTKFSAHPSLVTFIRDLASTIATEIILLDVTTIILGGGVINMKDFPKETLEKEILKYLRNDYDVNALQLFYTTSESENGIIGASMLAFNALEEL
jgi:ribulose-phosphate 3-epimerase